MTEYLIYFNQQWVGDHSEEWFRGRGPLAMAVVDEMKAACVYVFAGGLEEDGPVYSADPTGGDVLITDGPYVETKEWLGGFAVVDVADDEAARMWRARSRRHAVGPMRFAASSRSLRPGDCIVETHSSALTCRRPHHPAPAVGVPTIPQPGGAKPG
jgi:hypothetical protein